MANTIKIDMLENNGLTLYLTWQKQVLDHPQKKKIKNSKYLTGDEFIGYRNHP